MNISLKCFGNYFFRVLLVFIIFLLIFEFCVFLIISRDKRNYKYIKNIWDYENVLCGKNGIRKEPPDLPKATYCPTRGIITAFKAPDLSKSMWQYANIFSGAIALGIDGFIPICIRNLLGQIFDNLTIPNISTIGSCVLPLPDSASTLDEWMGGSQSIVLRTEDLYGEVVAKYLELVKRHFVFNRFLSEIALSFLLRAKGSLRDVTFIGVYIKETDIIVRQEFDDIYPSVQFFEEAMNEFRRDYDNALFIVITDHDSFWRSLFDPKDTYIVGKEINDIFGAPLALLSHCNHSILGMDDFPVWGAILAGGKTIVSLSLGEEYNHVMQYYDNWVHLINITKSEINSFPRIY